MIYSYWLCTICPTLCSPTPSLIMLLTCSCYGVSESSSSPYLFSSPAALPCYVLNPKTLRVPWNFILDRAPCCVRFRLPNTTDLNRPINHNGVVTTPSGVVVVAANLSAASLPGMPAWPGTHARPIRFPLAWLFHIVLAICRMRDWLF